MTAHSFQMLGSSSSGNCGLVTVQDTRILIDAGFSGKKICQFLAEREISIESIDAVFLTHEHADHAQGIRGLSKFKHLRWMANRGTFEGINQTLRSRVNWSIFETGTRFKFKDIDVETFSIPHDASDPVGYLFSWGGEDLFNPERSLAWVMDLGYATNLVIEKISRADMLVLEANYDSSLLELDSKRPWSVKQRIMSRHGHLSNQAACNLIERIGSQLPENILLAHVSRDCNSLEALSKTFTNTIPAESRKKTQVSWFNPESGLIEPLI